MTGLKGIKNESWEDRYFDLRSLSHYSSLSVSSLRTHIKCNGLSAFRVQGKIIVKRSEFEKWLEGYRMTESQDLVLLVDGCIQDLKAVEPDT